MKYKKEIIDKIFDYKTISNKEKIDILLEIDVNQYTNCGIDSTKTEIETVKRNSTYIYKIIQKINPEMGKQFLQHQDR
jgi:hypothetical protein|tara:strand:+ start:232 stop:465 length:234 start_codon:yes stop_codon:yes gene_type:complete